MSTVRRHDREYKPSLPVIVVEMFENHEPLGSIESTIIEFARREE